MIRLVARLQDTGAAINIGGNVETTLKTFDVDVPALEEFLRLESANRKACEDYNRQFPNMNKMWPTVSVQVIGAEVLVRAADAPAEKG